MFKEKLLEAVEFLSVRTPPMLGVDISSSAIKIVELAPSPKDAYRVERYVIEPLPKDVVVEGNIANLQTAGETLKRAWRRLGSRVRNVALALPSATVITKKVVIPAVQREEEMEVQVESEANQYIPFTLDEVNLDFQVIGPSANNPEEMEILIAASRKEKVEDRIAVAQTAGLKAVIMDVESYAAQAAVELVMLQLPGKGKNQVIALVDIGATMMRITIYHNGASVYVREQQVGGNLLTQDIARHFSVTAEEAENAKRSGGLPENYQPEVLQPFLENVALEVARALQFFFTSTQFSKVDHILLGGGCARLPGLDESVANRTQVNTVVANPFAKMSLSPRIKQRQLIADAPSLLVACGLALRRFDE